MTDKQSYHDAGGNAHLFVRRDRIEGLILRSQVDLPDRTPIVVAVPPAKLLAMIDTVDPDAMRAYLRERSDYLDSPAAGAAAEHFDYLERPMRICDPVPEADSPEDVDERPGRDDPTERAQIDRAWAMTHAAAVLGRLVAATGAESGELPVTGYASWILTGSTETLDR